MTEFLLKYAKDGKHIQWWEESFSSIAEIVDQVFDWSDPQTFSKDEMMSVIEVEVVDGVHEWRGDVTSDVKELLRARDQVRMEREYMQHVSDYNFDMYCELNRRFA